MKKESRDLSVCSQISGNFRLLKQFLLLFLLFGVTQYAAGEDLDSGETGGNSPGILSQQSQVSGRVTDVTGQPLPGVTVVVKGTTQGTVTDGGGNYVLTNVSSGATLVFSFVGMKPQEILVGNQSNISVRMEEATIGLEEVVAVGYGTMKKSDLTGSVTSVESENINAFPTTNVLQALAGRAAGVQILQTSGEPGGAISVRIRGTNSIRGSNEPLYVVDGFPVSGSNPTILNNLDIESIEILKDASATSIYGSRGANGVVLITTKTGQAGRTSVHWESNFGFQSLPKRMEMMNASEYAEFYNRVAVIDGWTPFFTDTQIKEFGEGFDWQDFVFRTAMIQNHDVTVSGGNEKTHFAMSGSIFDEDGIIENSGYKRYSARSNITHRINDKISVSSFITLSRNTKDNQSSSGGGRGTSLISGALYPFPTVTPYNEDGSIRNLKTIYHWSPEIINPVLYMYETMSTDRSNKVLANASVEYEPVRNLVLKIMGGIENSDDRSDYYRTRDYLGAEAYASVSTSQFTSLLNENTLSYSTVFGKHSISGLAGFTYQDFKSTSLSASGTGFLSDVQESHGLSSAAVPGIPGSGYSLSVILSGLGRINYNYADKYLFTANFRADGSSKYSEGKKWGYFPSGAFAWRASNEEFLKGTNLFSDLKFRLGWGLTGSQAISAYATLNNLSSGKTVFGDVYYNTFAPGTNLPGDLKWETTEQYNIGIDAGFLENRLRVTADYYIKNTRDLLNTVSLPSSLGFRTTIDNVGAISNKGLDLEVFADLLSGPVKWVVEGNISFNRNKVVKLYKGQDIQGSYTNVTLINDFFNLLREGEPIGVFYGYKESGYDKNGRPQYMDLNHDGSLNASDKTIIGDPNPNYIFGLNSTLSWKNFDFILFLQGVMGNDIYNLAGLNNTLDVGFGGNMPKEVFYNHWTPEKPDAKYPLPSRNNQIRSSDRFIEDGSYLRFRNIQIGYNIPFEKLGLRNIRNVQVYVGGKNLFTITKYSRWDPEVNSFGGASSVNQGIDHHTYPVNKSVNFGIRADF